jgi:hypothetical protein
MTAPFALPDVVDIWNANDDTLLFSSVACRVVPCILKTFSVWNSATNTQVTGITHWVDMEDQSNKWEYAGLIAALHYSWDFDAGVIMKLNYGGWELQLRAMWQELRFTGTPDYYHRIYCSRISQLVS